MQKIGKISEFITEEEYKKHSKYIVEYFEKEKVTARVALCVLKLIEIAIKEECGVCCEIWKEKQDISIQ